MFGYFQRQVITCRHILTQIRAYVNVILTEEKKRKTQTYDEFRTRDSWINISESIGK